jgi:hypothetical protein
MRQKDILTILNWALPRLASVAPESVNASIKLSHLESFREAVDVLDETMIFAADTSELKKSFLFRRPDDEIYVAMEAWRAISSHYYSLNKRVQDLISAISSEELHVENGISIRLPPIKDFDELAGVANELKKAIAIPISEAEIGGTVSIEAADTGSVWLYVALGTPTALTLVAAMAWAAAVIFKKWQEALVNREYLKSLRIQNETFQNIADAQKTTIDLLMLEEVKKIDDEFFEKRDPERVERLRLAVNTLTELVQRGLVIEPSMLSSEQASNLFPDMHALKFQPSLTKQIPENIE